MTTYNDVFTSILAMDSYHKNNNQGVFLKGAGEKGENGKPLDDVNNVQLGEAKIIASSVNKAQSFYAIAYQFPDGHVVISYRGTDDLPKDVTSGWLVGAGVVEDNQAALAIKFYEDVVKQLGGASTEDFTVFDRLPTSLSHSISFTGHSLGGGLAGLVANDLIAFEMVV